MSSRKWGSFLLMNNLEKTTEAVDCVAHDVDGHDEGDGAAGRTEAVDDDVEGTQDTMGWTGVVVMLAMSSGAGAIDLMSSSAVTGVNLTLGAAIGDRRSKS